MKGKWIWTVMALMVLSGAATRAEDSLRAFGLEFTVISNALMTLNDEYPSLRAEQINAPECPDYGNGNTNEVEHVPFGVSVHLGEAQSGVYIYPDDAGCRADGLSLWGNAYGNVNGETNRLISSVTGTRESWGSYNVAVDLTPLGATSYTYQVWAGGTKTLHATNYGANSWVNTLNLEDYNPRVNPFFMTEMGPAVLIEFPHGTQFGVYGAASSGAPGVAGAGDRMIIIAEGATNQVNYVARVDVFGSENLPAFAINDSRIGMFGRPHKALGGVNFTAAGGRLTAAPFDGVITNGPTNGVMVDFKKGAVRWEAQTEPFALNGVDATFLLSASGWGTISNRGTELYSGPVGLTRSNGLLHLSADFSGLDTSNSVLHVFRSNVLSGSIYGSNSTAIATLAETNPLVTGWAVTTQSLSISIVEPTRVTGHEGTILEGDRFEFAPVGSPLRIRYFSTSHFLALGMSGCTITSEATEELRLPEPRLEIERVPTGLLVSWPALGGYYAVVRTNLAKEPTAIFYPQYNDPRSYVVIDPTNAVQFISLRHYYYYYSMP